MDKNLTSPKLVCTLSDHSRDAQALEWPDLQTLALTTSRIDGGVASTFPSSMADRIEDLVSRENACCGTWLRTRTTIVADQLRLELTTTNPDGESLIHTMCGLDNSINGQ